MFPSTTFTNEAATAGAKSQLNLSTLDAGNHRGPVPALLLSAAALRWNQRGVAGAPNIPSRALNVGLSSFLLPTLEVITVGGKVRYTVGQSAPCAFAGTGLPANATGIEGFTFKIERLTPGSEVVAYMREFWIPFYAVDTLLANVAIHVGNITAV